MFKCFGRTLLSSFRIRLNCLLRSGRGEFGATYAYKTTTPEAQDVAKLRKRRGNHGIRLSEVPEDQIFQNIPTYAKRGQNHFPEWKIRYIENNREFHRKFYKDHKVWFDEWKRKIGVFPATWQRFEWNCQGWYNT